MAGDVDKLVVLGMSSEDTDFEEGEGSGESLDSEEEKYKVHLSSANYNKMEYSDNESNKKRDPASRSANTPARVRRVVSCKRKTRHLTVSSGTVRRKPSVTARTHEGFSKSTGHGDKAERLDRGHCEPRLSGSRGNRMEEAYEIYCDYFIEILKDHKQMTQVLCGRNLRLNLALTLWRRNIGELLTFLMKFQDLSVLVDCLPVITKSLKDPCTHISIGFCVDLFPLVKKVLRSHYEDHHIPALLWLQALLTKWQPQLSLRDGGEHDMCSCDYRNIHAIKQQLRGLWRDRQKLHFATKTTAEIWKVIESQLYRLHI